LEENLEKHAGHGHTDTASSVKGIKQIPRGAENESAQRMKANLINKCVQLINDILEGNSQDVEMFKKMTIVNENLLMELLSRQFTDYMIGIAVRDKYKVRNLFLK
jgi:hypothetical protein